MTVTAVGGPLNASGELEPTSIGVEVRDGNGKVVRFDDDNRADASGKHANLTMPAGSRSLEVTLPSGDEYLFEARAADGAGNLLAHGDARQQLTAKGDHTVAIDLRSLLGEADLRPRLPVHSLLAGQELDLLFSVRPRERPDLFVAATDYEANYELKNAEALEVSRQGVRVRAGQPVDGDLVVTATASGIVLRGSTAEPGSVKAALRLPFRSKATVDLEPPTLSGLAFDAATSTIHGKATDAVGIVRLEAYDGPVLLATTDLDVAAHMGVPEVVFPGGRTRFQAPVHLSSGDYSLTIIATDFSENETQQGLVIAVP